MYCSRSRLSVSSPSTPMARPNSPASSDSDLRGGESRFANARRKCADHSATRSALPSPNRFGMDSPTVMRIAAVNAKDAIAEIGARRPMPPSPIASSDRPKVICAAGMPTQPIVRVIATVHRCMAATWGFKVVEDTYENFRPAPTGTLARYDTVASDGDERVLSSDQPCIEPNEHSDEGDGQAETHLSARVRSEQTVCARNSGLGWVRPCGLGNGGWSGSFIDWSP